MEWEEEVTLRTHSVEEWGKINLTEVIQILVLEWVLLEWVTWVVEIAAIVVAFKIVKRKISYMEVDLVSQITLWEVQLNQGSNNK